MTCNEEIALHPADTALFVAAGVQVIGHVNEKKGLETYTNVAGTPGPPNVTYDKDYSIKLGTTEVAHVYGHGPQFGRSP